MERKTLSLSECELKLEGESGKLRGYASVFNGVDSYGDTILKGAFEKTLKKNGLPKMFLMHESYELPIGKWLSATEDDKGLFVEGELTPGMTRASDTYAALKHETLDGLSIGYALAKGEYEPSSTVEGGRIIKQIARLVEISPVVFPADNKARITAVKAEELKEEIEQLETIRDFERFLRDTGSFSKGLTEALVSRAKIVFAQGDPERTAMDAKAEEKIRHILSKV